MAGQGILISSANSVGGNCRSGGFMINWACLFVMGPSG